MELRRLQCYIVINCLILIRYLSAKSFNLNEAIAAESKLKQTVDTTGSFNSAESTGQRFSLNKALTTDPQNKIRKFKTGPFELGKATSLKKRKSRQLKKSSRGSKLSQLFDPLNLRRNSSKKREVYKHDQIDKKYFPLLKNLGFLLNNLLNSEQVDSYEVTKSKYKRHKHRPERRRAVVCKCALQTDSETGESKSYQTATVVAEAPNTEVPSTTAPAIATFVGNVGSFRQDKNISLLLPRNTASNRGNRNGHSERGSSSLYRSTERNISRNPRNRKYSPRIRESVTIPESYEENTDSNSRISAGGDEHRRGRNRGNTADSNDRETYEYETDFEKGQNTNDTLRELVYGHTRKISHKTTRNKTESKELVPEYIRGLRRSAPETKVSDVTKLIQSQENDEEGFYHVAFNNTSDKRIADGGCSTSSEDKEVDARDEAMMLVKDLSDLNQALQTGPKMKAPSVTIFDGYSVARDKNGQNKLTEKTIHIHTT